jgi:hypothetical protein
MIRWFWKGTMAKSIDQQIKDAMARKVVGRTTELYKGVVLELYQRIRLPQRIGEILYAGVPHSRKRGHARCGRGSGMNMPYVLLIHSHCQPCDART